MAVDRGVAQDLGGEWGPQQGLKEAGLVYPELTETGSSRDTRNLTQAFYRPLLRSKSLELLEYFSLKFIFDQSSQDELWIRTLNCGLTHALPWCSTGHVASTLWACLSVSISEKWVVE